MIATCFALVGFAAGIVVGWAAGNPTDTILWRSLVAFLLCYIVGNIIGSVAQRAIDDNVAAYKRENPIPQDPLREAADGKPSEPVEDSEPVTSRSAA